MEKANRITVQRTGLPPLEFEGSLLASQTQPLPKSQKATGDSRRWHELVIWELANPKPGQAVVLSVGFRTNYELETAQDTVFVLPDLASAVELLTEATDLSVDDPEYNPLDFLEGFPDQPQYAKKQENLERRVLEDFSNRVSRLLADAGVVEQL